MTDRPTEQELIGIGKKALPDEVPPTLRGAWIEWVDDSVVWTCAFDADASEQDWQSLHSAGARVNDNLPDHIAFAGRYSTVSSEQRLPSRSGLVYRRAEVTG